MVQAIFAAGELLAFHACARVREGAQGGASHKRSIAVPAVRHHMAELGKELGWHGALSADVILGPAGPVFIDINPRLVEPVNALRSGVDLVASLLEVARSAPQEPQPAASAGVSTHQLLLAVLGAAQHGGRRDILGELLTACLHRGAYRNSTEELTPLRHDPRSGVLLAVAVAATVIRPRAWKWFASGSVAAYALTPAGWARLPTGRRSGTPAEAVKPQYPERPTRAVSEHRRWSMSRPSGDLPSAPRGTSAQIMLNNVI